MKGAYSTTPETMATTNKSAISPMNRPPGRPRNRSVCRPRSSCMAVTPLPAAATCSSSAPLRASKRRRWIWLAAASNVGLRPTTTTGSSSSRTTYSGHSPGWRRSASARMASIFASWPGACAAGAGWPQASISSVNTSGKPLMQASSSHSVHTRLETVCTQDHQRSRWAARGALCCAIAQPAQKLARSVSMALRGSPQTL